MNLDDIERNAKKADAHRACCNVDWMYIRPSSAVALVAIARAAERFVDEQGKRTRDDGTLVEPQDFAAGCWRDLVAAVKAAGR